MQNLVVAEKWQNNSLKSKTFDFYDGTQAAVRVLIIESSFLLHVQLTSCHGQTSFAGEDETPPSVDSNQQSRRRHHRRMMLTPQQATH